jgi:tripartite-type tricarboxylate transporter receptor subunit TctC
MQKNIYVAAVAILGASVAWSGTAFAACKGYPAKPVNIIVPFPAGSATDTAARRISEELRQTLGQNFLVENMPGADGTVAARRVAAAEADGHTLFITTNTTHAANPAIYGELPYDPQADFDSIGGILRISYMLAVNKDNPANTLSEFIDEAKASAQPKSYGSGNMGGQVSGELLKERLDFEMVNVPYRGTPQGLTDLIANRIDVFFPDPASALGVMDQIKILGITGPERISTMPDIPTIAEQGVEGYSVAAFVAAFAPAQTPDTVVSCLSDALTGALGNPDIVEFIQSIGAEPMIMTPGELDTFVADEIVRWKELVEIAGIERK